MNAAAPTISAARALEAPSPFLVKIRDLVYQVAGIFQPDNKLRLLEGRCFKRMREIKVEEALPPCRRVFREFR